MNNKIYSMLRAIYGTANRSINVLAVNKNGEEKVTISVFDIKNGNYDEIHYATFDSEQKALDFYENIINEMKVTESEKRNEVDYFEQTGYLNENPDGSYTIMNYNNEPVDIESRKNDVSEDDAKLDAPFEAEIIGYSTRNNFTNNNGKVYVNMLLSIPIDVEPSKLRYDKISDTGKHESINFWNIRGFRRMLKMLRNKLVSYNSYLNTDANTKINVFELFYDGNKVRKY